MLLDASKSKGTLDAIMGDKGRMAFNASRMCCGHREVSAYCAAQVSSLQTADGEFVSKKLPMLNMCARFISKTKVVQMSVGVASGASAVGNVGAKELRIYNLLSTLAGWTHACERIAEQDGASPCLGCCIADAAVAEQAHGIMLRAVPYLMQHCKHRSNE
eukprot:gene56902-biopygen87684